VPSLTSRQRRKKEKAKKNEPVRTSTMLAETKPGKHTDLARDAPGMQKHRRLPLQHDMATLKDYMLWPPRSSSKVLKGALE